MTHWARRREIIETARRSVSAGLTYGTSGNVSVRVPEGFLVTPTGVPYDQLQPSDIVLLDAAGKGEPRQRKPSSEWRIHRDIYVARPDAGAVVHVHPTFATTISCLRRDLPAVHYMLAAAGGAPVRCAAYATFGTQELSDAVLAALEGRHACLMANHGLVAIAPDLDCALTTAVEVEKVSEVYWRALSVGSPVVLDEAEMARVMEAFKDYGQQPAT